MSPRPTFIRLSGKQAKPQFVIASSFTARSPASPASSHASRGPHSLLSILKRASCSCHSFLLSVLHLRSSTSSSTQPDQLRLIMALVLRTVLALAIAACALAAPKTSSLARKGFVINQVAINAGNLRSGTNAVYRTYRRYGVPVPDVVEKANAATNSTVAAIPEQFDAMYLTPVALGSGGRVVNLDIDTGSADFWTFSSNMTAGERGGHDFYDPANSSTSKKMDGAKWEIQYGDGTTAEGEVYTDKVSVAGVTAGAQAIGAADKVSEQFLQDPDCDGLVGLAFSSINSGTCSRPHSFTYHAGSSPLLTRSMMTVTPRKQPTFFDNIKASLPQPIFAVDLRKGAPGTYQFGAVDPSRYSGAIAYAPVDAQRTGLWHFTASGYAIGGGAANSTPVEAVADTGSSVMYLPDDIVQAYYAQVAGASNSAAMAGYVFACDAQLPDFTLQIGPHAARVPGSYINYAPNQDGSNSEFTSSPSHSLLLWSGFG